MIGRTTKRGLAGGLSGLAPFRPQRVKFEEVPGLAERRIAVFQAAFDRYRSTEEWPTFRKVARELVEALDAEEAVKGLGFPWVDSQVGGNNPLILRVPAIARCKGSEEILDAFIAALRLGVKKYFTKGIEPNLTQQNLVAEAGLSNELAHHALLLLKSENVWEGIQGIEPGEMVMTVGNGVRQYKDVTSNEEYVAIALDGAGPKGALGGRPVYVPAEEGPDERRSHIPDTAFVMMWLARDNPDREAVAAAIRQAFEPYGITAVHAMDVDHDGIITDVILQQIRDAEFLVADLTGARPSVYYEVGYAHALGKRPMLVRKRDTPVHFDLSVHNAPDYEDAADLKRLMARRLDERIGPPPSQVARSTVGSSDARPPPQVPRRAG